MNPERPGLQPAVATPAGLRLGKVILRLVKGGPERLALEAGQVDAIVDPASGTAILLPDAQRTLLMSSAQNRLARAGLEALDAQIGILDAAGVVLLANAAWSERGQTGIGAGVAEGDSYLEACGRAGDPDRVDAIAIAAGVRQVLAGARARFVYEQACDTPEGRRWFLLAITAVTGDRAARAIVAREDITGARRAERLLQLEQAVALGLAAAGDAATALQGVIRAVCEAQGWDCGRYFRLDRAAGLLRHTEAWGVPAPAVQAFLEQSRNLVFRPGAGLTGRVCQSGEPLWARAGASRAGASPTALAPETGGDGAFVFPVTRDEEIVGVLAFAGAAVGEPDDRLLRAARSIGAQLGAFLHRQQALDILRRSEAHYRRVTELSSDWYWEQDRDFRFTHYSGRALPGAGEVLGKTHWELPGIVPDTATWDEHQAQLAAQWSFCDFEFSIVQAGGDTGHYCISGEPFYDDTGACCGYCGTGLDITRRKRTELALRESEARLRALADATSG